MKNILLVGVGGQGTLLASKLLTVGLMMHGYDVKMSEIHGMSQRGGSVSSQIRYGDKVWSPVIEAGSADILVAFEKMEALRWMEYLNPEGSIVVNDYQISPMPVLSSNAEYPDDIIEMLQEKARVTVINANEEAQLLGNARVMNIILLGATIQDMGLDNIDWNQIIKENVKPAFVELNQRALARGMALVAAAKAQG